MKSKIDSTEGQFNRDGSFNQLEKEEKKVEHNCLLESGNT